MRRPSFWIALALAGALAACSSDDGGGGGDADAGDTGFTADAGPTDDAAAVPVEVPSAPRAFTMALGAPTTGPSDVLDAAWDRATANADVALVWIDGGLPWPEILAGDPLPPDFTAHLDALEARATGGDATVMVVVDVLAPDRGGLVADYDGRGTVPSLTDPEVVDAYAAFCGALAERFDPTWFVPVVDLNVWTANRPESVEAMRQFYIEARREVQTVAGRARVFPLWDYQVLLDVTDAQDPEGLGVLSRFDELLDLFAIDFAPAEQLRGVGQLPDAEFDFLEGLSTRPLAVVASYPANGFVRDGDVFASSENSQFNFLAWLFDRGDGMSMDLVAWRMSVDPDPILAAPCEGVDPPCDPDRLTDRYETLRSTGLVTPDGDTRRSWDLWLDFLDRPIGG